MDVKKLTFTDQVSSARRKVVLGVGLGLISCFIILSFVLFNVSIKAPFLHSVFQGFNNNSNDKNLSWPFSLPRSSIATFSSSSLNGTSSSNNTAISGKLQHHYWVLNETLNANVSENGKDQSFSTGYDNGVVFEDANSEKNGSFRLDNNGVDDKTNIVNGSQADKDLRFPSVVGEGMILRKIDEANFSYVMKNGSSIEKNVEEGNVSYSNENVERDGGNGGILSVSEKGSAYSNDSGSVMVDDSLQGECDIFHGRWVRDDTKPYYPPGSCPYIDKDFDCHRNGRPEDGYVKWRWQPFGCNIPSLNATDFLERLRGKKLVFVGDSLNRNMWESLVCILRHSVPDKKRVYEISGRMEFKKKGLYAFRFEDYNCSVDFVGSTFLVKESSYVGKNGSSDTLRLDLMDQTTSVYHDADVIIFNTGHWWTHEKTARGEGYYQEGNYVHTRLKVLEAYKRALTTWARWVDKNIDSSRTQVVFRGYSVTHFRGGPWNSGGKCHKETEPITNDAYLAKYPSKMRAFEHVLRDMKTPVVYLNISRLTDYRKDAHPSIYRKQYKPEEQLVGDHVEDCSHWCLPGVPDTWNELLYAALLRTRLGSWRA